MRVAVGLVDGLGLDGDRCIRVIPQHHVPYELVGMGCFTISYSG